ncbi:sugar ABC transporter substrate-binding protein [Sediminivirga luteola]|uniref:Sugar ABC transporter substrate-binding protein n=1 Tax=Sediminivirga luteola TaxID=1774748 RepID=A0A8J2XMJ7_9MICO|nr:substrate-binding domain-containing protein [Sediminivirga luteola]GGA27096.1 sugar ABC transporter substrate-binding protein [Sediminivirga luteola]
MSTLSTRTLTFTGLAAVAAFGLAACGDGGGEAAGGQGGDESVTVTVVTPYLANAATGEAIDLFTAEGEERGWTVSVVDTAGDMNRLNSAFQDAAAQQPDAIVLGTGDPAQISLGLRAAGDAGVPVFAIDAGEDEGIAANVTSDNTDLGEQSAQALIDEVGADGRVLMLTHDPHPGVRERAEGARAVFEEAGVEILDQVHVEVPGPVDDARTSVQDALSARGTGDDGITGIWGGWDEPALGATQALQAANVDDVPVVGVDGQDFAVAEIEKGGPFVATVKQDWPAIAAEVASLIEALVEDGVEPEQRQYELPGTLITQE